MDGLKITVLLGAAVLAGTLLAPRLRIATPLILVALGILLAFVPEVREVQLPPEAVLLLFLPVMLFWESMTTSLRSIQRDLRGIVLLSTLLVVATAFAVAGIAHLMGLPWEAALILGAAVAPPDATAVAALGRMLPRRNFTLLKAESLTNDGTALVVYAIAVGLATGGSYTPLDVTGMVALSYVGGIAAGVVVGLLVVAVMLRLTEALAINIALVLVPFTAFLAAELIHASGVLAVVVSGLIVAYAGPRISTAGSRRQTEAVWPLGSFLLNGALFVLIGIEAQVVVRDISAEAVAWLSVVTIAVWIVLMAVRFVFQTLSITVIRVLDRRPSQRQRRMTYRARVVSSFAGFRGAVSLAIALSVPVLTDTGEALAGRDEIVFVTAGVILLTLLVQGPLLPVIVRWARLPEDAQEQEEEQLAERAVSSAAVAAIDELADELGIGDRARDELRQDYRRHLELAKPRLLEGEDSTDDPDRLSNVLGEDEGDIAPVDAGPGDAADQQARLRLAVLGRKREVLLRLRRDGTVDDAVARRIQTRLDIEELRLTGPEPLD